MLELVSWNQPVMSNEGKFSIKLQEFWSGFELKLVRGSNPCDMSPLSRLVYTYLF